MSNRDFFTKPVQGSRSAHDYGRSNLPFEGDPYSRVGWREVLATAIIVAALVFFAVSR